MSRVLVVDDHQDMCRAVVLMLRMQGVDCKCVTTGQEALNYLRGNPVGLVILDYMMPDLNGLEVLRAMRADERTQRIPVVLCTALNEEMVAGDAIELGAQEFLPKSGISMENLLRLVQQYAPALAS